MRLRSPAEFYIKALFADTRRLTDEQVQEQLAEDGVDYISTAYLTRLRKKMKVPEPFHPSKQNHIASQQFLVREKLRRFFQPDKLMREALLVFEKPRVREAVESMLLGRVPATSISELIKRTFNVTCTPAGLAIFTHFFWNVDLLDSTQMRLLIKLRFDRDEDDDTFKGRKKLLSSSYFDDARATASTLPSMPASALVVQLRLGFLPNRHELASRLLEVQRIAWLKAIESLAHNGLNDSQKFLNYVHASKLVEEMMQSVARPEDQLREQINTIGLKVETRLLPTITSLSGGAHTVEMTPIEEDRDDSKPRS